jgi:hypothetical protein
MPHHGKLLTLKGSSAETANGNSAAVEVEGEALAATLDMTAVGGTTPTLDVVLEDAPNDTGPWTTLSTFGQKTAVSKEVQRVTNKAFHRFIRARWTIGGSGSPNFTFSVQATLR